jgi:uncharacterized protein (TIGR02300 family)
MVNAELGTKRTCPSCAARFYDLLKDPITCPKCGTSFIAQSILPSKSDYPGVVPQAAPKPREADESDEADINDVELVSLEDVEEDGKAAVGTCDTTQADPVSTANPNDGNFIVSLRSWPLVANMGLKTLGQTG